MTPRILVIAGSDSGGGAGIQADIKTITMLGGHATTAITAITAQNTLGVQAVMPVPVDIVLAQIDSVVRDIGVDAVKIGMLGSAEIAVAVADCLEALPSSPPKRGPIIRPSSGEPAEVGSRFGGNDGVGHGLPVVFDPVMVATSGAVLADADTIAAFGRLMRLATLVTPNLPELDALGGEAAVRASGAALLIKGGHGDDPDQVVDTLVLPGGERIDWRGGRIATAHTHGTGCTLASAIAEGLARGMALPAAIDRARRFVRIALHEAPGLGGGHGPMGQQRVRLDIAGERPTLNQVTLPVTDHAASAAFYRALGLTPIVESGDRYTRFETAGGATLSIETADEMPGGPIMFLEVADLDRTIAAVRAAGIAVADPVDQRWGWREARLADPAGNALRLYQAGEMRRFPPWRLPDA